MLTGILLVSFLFKRTEAIKPIYQFLFVDSLGFFALRYIEQIYPGILMKTAQFVLYTMF